MANKSLTVTDKPSILFAKSNQMALKQAPNSKKFLSEMSLVKAVFVLCFKT